MNQGKSLAELCGVKCLNYFLQKYIEEQSFKNFLFIFILSFYICSYVYILFREQSFNNNYYHKK
jgi:hypothetical protein